MELLYKEIRIPGLRSFLFLATRRDTGSNVVVKFSSYYGTEVHQKMAECSMAPDVYAHLSVGGMVMVIMEYIEGEGWPDHPTSLKKKQSPRNSS